MNNTKYVDPLIDAAFKRIFGTDPNKDLLIAFLNEVFKGRKRIVDLVYNKNEHHGKNKTEGSAIFDLLCTGDQGEKILIEVQNSRPVNFKKRAIFYTSRLISEQAPKGAMDTWKYDITEVYFLAILDEKLKVGEEYFHDICLCHRNTGEIFYEGLGFTFIELSNFVKTSDELESDLDRWLYSLKHLSEMDDLPSELRKPIFEKLYNIAEYSNMTKEEQEIYDSELKRKWDNEAVKEQQRLDFEAVKEQQRLDFEAVQEQQRLEFEAVQEQQRLDFEAVKEQQRLEFEEEKERSRVESKIEGKREIALTFKKMGLSNEQISEGTGLSIDEIEKL